MSLFLGKRMERAARRRLEAAGLRTVATNYRTAGGEIDLIMQDDNELVFVEVRYRRTATHGTPAESVSTTKQRRVIRAARQYLAAHSNGNVPCRIDVVALTSGAAGSIEFDWQPGAITLDTAYARDEWHS